MDTLLTFPNRRTRYPITRQLDGYNLFATCDTVLDRLQEVQHEYDYPGFELFFTGTSGASIATAIAAMNKEVSAPMDLAYSQVAKEVGEGHHRMRVETTHNCREKKDFATVFVDDLMSSGDTYRRTKRRVQSAADEMSNVRDGFYNFDGIVVLSGKVCAEFHDVQFIIRPM